MSTKTKKKPAKSKTPASIVWFEIPVDDSNRAKKFYGKLFGWKINPMPHMADYHHIDTAGAESSPDGALMKRMCPEHVGVTNYIMVDSVDKMSSIVKKLGGKVHKPKTAVPGMGYFALCLDTEGNVFAMWERNESAK